MFLSAEQCCTAVRQGIHRHWSLLTREIYKVKADAIIAYI